MNPRPRIPLTFSRPFTREDALAAGVTIAALRGWRERNEVCELAAGVYVPAAMADDKALRAIWTDQAVARGTKLVSVAGAALMHRLWTPPQLHQSLTEARPLRTVPEAHCMRVGPLVLPDRAWTAVSLGRWQRLEGAVVGVDSALRLGESRTRLSESLQCMDRWPGVAALSGAIEEGQPLSESALESWSRGLMVRYEVPRPDVQRAMTIAGRRVIPDFTWVERSVIGEADGQEKYRSTAGEVFAEKRRQADLQAAGFTVYRWGWPEVRDDASGWIRGLRRLVG